MRRKEDDKDARQRRATKRDDKGRGSRCDGSSGPHFSPPSEKCAPSGPNGAGPAALRAAHSSTRNFRRKDGFTNRPPPRSQYGGGGGLIGSGETGWDPVLQPVGWCRTASQAVPRSQCEGLLRPARLSSGGGLVGQWTRYRSGRPGKKVPGEKVPLSLRWWTGFNPQVLEEGMSTGRQKSSTRCPLECDVDGLRATHRLPPLTDLQTQWRCESPESRWGASDRFPESRDPPEKRSHLQRVGRRLLFHATHG